jgi:hypothetical protein
MRVSVLVGENLLKPLLVLQTYYFLQTVTYIYFYIANNSYYLLLLLYIGVIRLQYFLPDLYFRSHIVKVLLFSIVNTADRHYLYLPQGFRHNLSFCKAGVDLWFLYSHPIAEYVYTE